MHRVCQVKQPRERTARARGEDPRACDRLGRARVRRARARRRVSRADLRRDRAVPRRAGINGASASAAGAGDERRRCEVEWSPLVVTRVPDNGLRGGDERGRRPAPAVPGPVAGERGPVASGSAPAVPGHAPIGGGNGFDAIMHRTLGACGGRRTRAGRPCSGRTACVAARGRRPGPRNPRVSSIEDSAGEGKVVSEWETRGRPSWPSPAA